MAQRVSSARVAVDGETVGAIGRGLLVYVGVEKGDGAEDVEYMARKLAGLRIFEDDGGRMNLAVTDAGAAVLLVSQFTLHGDARKGRRPSFTGAEAPDRAKEVFADLARKVSEAGLKVEEGVFQAHMEVESVNDGPVTMLLDSRRLF